MFNSGRHRILFYADTKTPQSDSLTAVQVGKGLGDHVGLGGLEVALAAEVVLSGHEPDDGVGLRDRGAVNLQQWNMAKWSSCV